MESTESLSEPKNTILVPSKQIYKMVHLDANQKYRRIIVFHGKREPIESLHEIFSDLEIANIELHKTEIIYSEQQIHTDDTIQTIKYKIIKAIDKESICYHSIYLFANIKTQIHLEKMYNEMTQKDDFEFTQPMLEKVWSNIHISEKEREAIPEKKVYSYEDLARMIPKTEIPLSIPIGKKFSSFRNLLFSVNPFEIESDDATIYQPNTYNTLLTYENSLLLNYGDIQDNVLFLCFAEDVLENAIQKNIDEKYVIHLYYPLLTKQNIFDKKTFSTEKSRLIDQNKTFLKPAVLRNQNVIDTFYNIYNGSLFEPPLSYISRGITSFEIILHPQIKTYLPLEALFKNIHANETVPYIKYNPGSRQENIYRLYTEKISKSGKKIPFLSKSHIISLSKQTGKQKAQRIRGGKTKSGFIARADCYAYSRKR
jgi:hypothetical protein